MSFNDLAAIYLHFQALPLGCLNTTDRLVIITIARWPSGCFIGESALALEVGTGVGNLRKVLGKLRRLGIVFTEHKYGRKGRRQCYHASVSGLGAYSESLSVKTPLPSLSTPKEELGISKTVEPISGVSNAYSVGHPYKEDKEYKYDKDKRERFNFVTKDLPPNVKARINYGSNIGDELDNCVRLGIGLEELKRALEAKDFSSADSVGGAFVHHLKGLKSSLAPTVKKPVQIFKPRECDICLSACKGSDMPLELFKQGRRCEIDSATMERIVKQRNGLAP